jgi:hypothetical protein
MAEVVRLHPVSETVAEAESAAVIWSNKTVARMTARGH